MKPLEDVSSVLKAALALAALLPGLSLVTGLVPLPPQMGKMAQLAGAVLGPILVLISILLREQIARLPVAGAALAALILTGGGFYLAGAYSQAGQQLIHEVRLPDQSCAGTTRLIIVEPSQPSDRLKQLLEDHTDFFSALATPEECAQVVEQMRIDARPDEDRLFWHLVVTQICFVCAFLILLWKAAAMLKEPQASVGA